MDFFNLIAEVEKIDPEFGERISPRRRVIKNMTGFGGKIALSSLPFALNALFTKAYGASVLPDPIAAVFNLALTLEYLESTFYVTGINSANLIPAEDLPAIQQISSDENHHVAFLQNLLGTQATPKPVFDFTGGGGTVTGPFIETFTSYARF